MRGPRLTIRALMAVVAAVGVALGVGLEATRLQRRRSEYRALAQKFAVRQQVELMTVRFRLSIYNLHKSLAAVDATYDRWQPPPRRYAMKYPGSENGYDDSLEEDISGFSKRMRSTLAQAADEARSDLIKSMKKVEYFESMKQKYERAAARPWVPVNPDPPEPN